MHGLPLPHQPVMQLRPGCLATPLAPPSLGYQPCRHALRGPARPRRCTIVAAEQKEETGSGAAEGFQRAGEAVNKAVQQGVANVKEAFDIIDDNVLEYCNLDPAGKRPKSRMSLGEKEALFMDALRSFYYDKEPMMGNEEFDNLKEDLLWEGSKVAILSSTEKKFMQASMAQQAGKPIMSDQEYDDIKNKLRTKGSLVVSQGPRCSLRSGNMYSDASPDYIKMTALNIPAAVGVLLALFLLDDFTGFQITNLLELPEPYGIVFTWGAVLPVVFVFVASITNFIFKDNLILRGQCPNCGAASSTYFGDILTVKGNREVNQLDCGNCKAKLEFSAPRREIKVASMPGAEDKKKGGKKGGAAAAKKKAAGAAAKKKESSTNEGAMAEKKEEQKSEA
eukprot:jgi/Astpho2/499/Aster-03540